MSISSGRNGLLETWSMSFHRVGFLILVVAASSGGCGAKRFPNMTDPVDAFLKEIRSGSQIVPRYRPYFTDSVKDQEIRHWFETIREALRRHGDTATVDVAERTESEAKIAVWVGEQTQDRPGFTVVVEDRLTGWRISAIDIRALGRLLPTTVEDAPFSKHNNNVWH